MEGDRRSITKHGERFAVNDPTTPDRIRKWLLEGRQTGATNVIVVCDTFEYDDYPVFVMPGQNPREVAKQYDNVNMQKIMEVYSLHKIVGSHLAFRQRV